MSLNLEMLQVVRLAPRLLGDSTELVANFLQGLINGDGGFSDRAGQSDLYYTSFGIGGLMGLQRPLPIAGLRRYLTPFGDGDGLDLVHLACLIRCLVAVEGRDLNPGLAAALLRRVDRFRAADGGFHTDPAAERGSVYGSFLAMGAYQDLRADLPNPAHLVASIQSCCCDDGGYANGLDLPIGLTPPSSAAAAMFRQLGTAADPRLEHWLWSRYRAGGFCVMEAIQVPDLLSTATALHALAGSQVDLSPICEDCLDFVDSLWNARGGFYGSWEDDELDCEYTYYGLLTLGHLSLFHSDIERIH